MPRETLHIVQAFAIKMDRGWKSYIPASMVSCKSADEARRKAEKLAGTVAGVIAYTVTGDAELGEYDETPAVLYVGGDVPEQFRPPDEGLLPFGGRG